jgi:ribonuclease HI
MSAAKLAGPPQVEIYTDGGCKPNPGAGGWGAVLLAGGRKVRELEGGEARTTNNRMEMMAALEALRSLREPHGVVLITDSTYLKNGITRWMKGWRKRSWMTQAGTPVANKDLWEALDRELERHQVRWRWTRGHSGNRWNERADELATRGRRQRAQAARAASFVPKAETASALPKKPADIHVYCAATCDARSGAGAWAVLTKGPRGEETRRGAGSATTANRLHLLAVIEALRGLQASVDVAIHTCSDYVKDGATRWLAGWCARGWRTASGRPVRNQDLWRELSALLGRHRASWPVPDRLELAAPMRAAKAAAREAPRLAGPPDQDEQGQLFGRG